MAGIGFELKKIYRKHRINNMIRGIGYSSIVTVGPTLVTIGIILFMYTFMGMMDARYAERELLSSTILYSFIFPLIVTTPINSVLSRYIADKMYQRKLEDVLPSFYVGLLISATILSIASVPFLYRMYQISDIELLFIAASYLMFVSTGIVFYSMTYLTATKDYRIIALQFVLGGVLAIGLGYFFYRYLELLPSRSILYGMTIGFFFIATGMFAYLKRYFKESSKNYKEVFRYFATFKRLFFSGLFYIVGLFCHNFIYWFSPLRIVVEDSYISAPAYDMATFLAMLTNISTMVIYIVLVETKFHDRYQIYSESIVRATFKDIEKAKNDMFRLLTQQISYLVQVQAIITSILFLLAVIFLPSFGFSGIIMEVYPALAAGYFVLFVMYANLIFLYYFNDMTGAFFTSAFFLIGVILSTLVLRETSMRFYGAGVFIGAFIGWTISFFRLRYLERHFDGYIFRQGKILEETSEEMPSPISYAKEESL